MPATTNKFRMVKNSIKAAAVKTIRPKRNKDNSTTILSLPQEMLREIIKEMSPQDRAPLGLVCRQIRCADLEVPREFERIDMRWDEKEQWIMPSKMDCRILGSNERPIQATPHILSFFGRAKADALCIMYEKDAEDPKADFEVITSLCEPMAFDKLRVRWCNTAIHADKFISGLLANRDSANVQLALTFHFARATTVPNIPSSRKLLMKLPKLKSFRLQWMGWSRLASAILDDSTLLHIVSNTDHAELDLAEFTAQGLLDSFEVVCKSNFSKKYVKLYLSKCWSKGVKEIMQRFQIHFTGMMTEYRHVDRERQAVLIISGRAYDDKVCFQMCKSDQNENATFDIIQW
ncbi:hypothetical protein PRIPAC_75625 [Pristionchus pacificus]|uniref:F-box domain-containing protein n=1 Tax=Pristionchus pacificus TaxID=54126 RepID=A0A2A6C7Y1_PRIPA|nr:hypothetical protein PRIPAC_75625 [Pristionchus pacificus]|eukprot:PDM74294.1 F-box domain-containing protein [Pristionchus pacificus]